MKLILLKRWEMLVEAELAAETLRQLDIPFVLQKDGVPGSTGLLQGAEIYVDENDFLRASKVMGGNPSQV